MEEREDEIYIYADSGNLGKVREMFLRNGYTVASTALIRKPITPVEIEDEEILSKITSFLDKLEDLDDVQRVYVNIA